MAQVAIFELEDALLAALKLQETKKQFAEFTILSSGVPRLIRAIEREWENSHVFIEGGPESRTHGSGALHDYPRRRC